MCGSSAFDDPLQLLGESPDTFMSNPTAEQLVATINTLTGSPQESVSPSSSDSESIDPTQAFNLDDFVKDFGVPVSQESESPDSIEERVEEQSIATTLSMISRNSPVMSSSHVESIGSPMPSFYVSTSSPAPTTQPTPEPTPPLATPHSYAPPRGATNANARRVGGSWKVPMAISRLASPIPSCAASPNQVVA